MPTATVLKKRHAATSGSSDRRLASSFRDPSGFLFHRNGTVYRQVNQSYRQHYDFLLSSGLYSALVGRGLLIRHEEIVLDGASPLTYKTLKPEVIPFVSYPYEWSFSQLQDAALATLQVQRLALQFGMSLKDSSAFNIQFNGGKPVLIDTLSFERYPEFVPWVAYRQFCQHFVAPLALMSLVDIRLSQLFQVHIDGVPIDLASRLLPWKKYLSFGLLIHLHTHALAQRHFSAKPRMTGARQMSRSGLLGLIDNLETTVRKLNWQPQPTEWANYYCRTHCESAGFQEKIRIVTDWLDQMAPPAQSVWDLGANTGLFSRLCSKRGIFTVSVDADPRCVEVNYRTCRQEQETHLLPLWVDLTNPSAAIGWQNLERMSFLSRGPVDLILALAFVHHLAVSNNLPLDKIAEFFAHSCKRLIIEFVPKTDTQMKKLLANCQDTVHDYSREAFEREFGIFFRVRDCVQVADSGRALYLMEKLG